MLLELKMKTLIKIMKKIQLITKGIVKNSPQKATLKMLSPLKKSSFKLSTGKVPALGPWATFLELKATRPWFRSICWLNLSDPVPVEDAVATNWCSVCSPPRLGVQLPQSPPPEIDNRFEEAGGQSQPRPSHKTRTH